jgi:hypothetical protein
MPDTALAVYDLHLYRAFGILPLIEGHMVGFFYNVLSRQRRVIGEKEARQENCYHGEEYGFHL